MVQQETFKVIDLKNLNKDQKEIIRYINKQVLEHQHMFLEQPAEILISNIDYKKLVGDEDKNSYSYLLLSTIKIYHI
jgi:hypothetical protein